MLAVTGDRDDRAEDPEEDRAGGQRDHERDGVELEFASEDDRREDVAVELLHADDQREDEQRGRDAVRGERDQDRHATGHERTDDRDERPDEGAHRERHRQRHVEQDQTDADRDRVDRREIA